MNIAIVAANKYFCTPIMERFEQQYHHKTDFFRTYSAAKLLFQKKFDGIYLWPAEMVSGENELVFVDDNYPERVGKRVLTDIIRSPNSVNMLTPTFVIVGMDFAGYSCEDYIKAGADFATLSAEDPRQPFKFFEEVFAQKRKN